MKLLCLDIEATQREEILELSIFSYDEGEEIYHSYFKPPYSKKWRLEPHNISPEMVQLAPSFKNERAVIQKIIDESDGIIGFDLSNDIKYLKQHEIVLPERLSFIDVKHWFWYYVGKELGICIDQVPKLSKCANILEFEFSEEKDAHSATNDTLMTLNLFNKILEKSKLFEITSEKLRNFQRAYDNEEEIYKKDRARGIMSLIPEIGGYKIKNNSLNGTLREEAVSVSVESRFIAEHEIRDFFESKKSETNHELYELDVKDIEWFKNYSNVYNATLEAFYRKMYKPPKKKKSSSANVIALQLKDNLKKH